MLVNFSSYNLFAFDQGRSLLYDRCKMQDFIAVKELWLSDFNVDKIINFHNYFADIARSAVTEKIRRRPFGGLAILATKSVISSCNVVGVDCNYQCLVAIAKLVTGRTVSSMFICHVLIPV